MDADLDAQAMVKVAKGDRQAFAALFSRHRMSVLRFALRYVGEPARAEELTQDIFVKVYRYAASYRPSARFKTFLFRVAANHCLNEVRRGEYPARPGRHGANGECEESATSDLLVEAHGPEDMLAGRELEACVARALGAMSPRERTAFALCRFEGMPYREIAQALETSEPAVKSLIHRATLVMAQHVAEARGASDAL